ncbi:IclR family transcriptional regulator [Candidimonas nitroreducens]|uniref:IclR family transcriptional regulator n=1 Tax=Candidimonas nitroreducens TaxID=683354 RepID=A0A225MZ92_9BURK|nr:IclR family transcriptional regulator [Candidimonas nitroreducens]OWT66392.1 hypothetical protein CEY11_01270 [Candidimonas nitroreducens]
MYKKPLEMETVHPPRESGLIGSLQKGFEIFDMFSRDHSVVTVSEIAKYLQLHKSSASRIAATLVALGYLRPAPNSSGFQLGGKLARLGNLAVIYTSLTGVAEPFIQKLAEETGETCHLGVLEGTEAVTVNLAEGSFSLRLHSWVGKRSPAHLTSMGKALLAGLSEGSLDMLYRGKKLETPTPNAISTLDALKNELAKVRSRGYALDDEELEIGLRCIAVPIFSHDERTVASLTIAGSASRIQLANIDDYVEKVRATAGLISEQLGAPPAAAARTG